MSQVPSLLVIPPDGNQVSISSDVFRNALAEFVYMRTYSRWLPSERRRERWHETVQRYFDFMRKHRPNFPSEVLNACQQAVLRMDVLPSMRALWSAGPAAERDNTYLYNCSFLPIDNLRAFSELLYILMCGTGCGFSVEREFVDNLPPVAPRRPGPILEYVVDDSTEGWADAFYFGLVHWWQGMDVRFDYSQVRPAGAVLRTKGGRASGPESLRKLLDFARGVVLGAAGRRVKPIECHDICCQVAEIVMVGGFRRAALISISSPDDLEMRHAKDWSRGDFPAIRYMANNSAFWKEKPDEKTFWDAWNALVQSGSGERGFLIDNYSKRADRAPNSCRTNPCVSANTWVDTTDGPRRVSQLVGKPFEAIVDGVVHASSNRGFWSTGKKVLYRLETEEGYSLELTGNHKVCRLVSTDPAPKFEWVMASSLQAGDRVRLNNHRAVQPPGDRVERARGWLVGAMLGDIFSSFPSNRDGCKRLYLVGEHGESLAKLAADQIELATGNSDADIRYEHHRKTWVVTHPVLADLVHDTYDMRLDHREVSKKMEEQSLDFAVGLLSGLFDLRASVHVDREDGISIQLSHSSMGSLEAAQRMLLRVGVAASIRPGWTRGHHDLVVSGDNVVRFDDVIGFSVQSKKALLHDLLGMHRKHLSQEPFTATVRELVMVGEAEVYDCSIPDLGAFSANGLYVHNCGEISLRYEKAVDPWTGEGGGGSFCNLTAAIMRPGDTFETMARKVQIATWLGVLQASFTHFPYLRPAWKDICEQDYLLGVDITGQCDNPSLSQDWDAMKRLNQVALDTAAVACAMMDKPLPVAITTGKPSGNSSQLVDCSSGFHPRYSRYYFRHVRISASDPLCKMLRDLGAPMFKEIGQEHLPDEEVKVWVVRFPVKAPEGAMVRDDESALEQLDRYLNIMRTWCSERGHNQSATIYVREHEWQEVGEWLYEHFDEVTGLSFLPYDGGKYRLPPYQEITEEEYLAAVREMPDIDYSLLSMYEEEDHGSGAREFACVGGSCEVDWSVEVEEANKIPQ